MMNYFKIDIGTNNSTQQQIQSMNSLRSSDGLVTVGLRRGSQLRHERKRSAQQVAPFVVERRARRINQLFNTRK